MGALPLDHFSVSQMGTLSRCPQQWAFRYIEDLKRPPSGAMIRGKALDEQQNIQVQKRIDGNPMDTKAQATEQAVTYAESECSDKEITGPDSTDKVVDQVARITPVAYDYVWESVKDPVSVQEEVRLSIPDGDGETFDLLGYLDLRTKDSVRDLKTSGRKWNSGREFKEPQAQVYGLLNILREDVASVEFVYDIFVPKTKEVLYDPRFLTVTMDSAQPVLQRLRWWNRNLHQRIITLGNGWDEIAFPPVREGWHCSHKWCGYAKLCEARHPELGPVDD